LSAGSARALRNFDIFDAVLNGVESSAAREVGNGRAVASLSSASAWR
jgi:hypothetical protein